MESLQSSTSVATSHVAALLTAQQNSVTYNAAISELKSIIGKHQGTYNDPLSERVVVWHKSTMDSLSNLKKNGANTQELECGLHESINSLRQEILVNPLDGSRLKQPFLERNWVWERWMHDDCSTLSPHSPLDNQPMDGATPHEFASEMLAWSEKIGLPIDSANGSAAHLNQTHMEYLAKHPRFTEGRRSVYARVCRAAQKALSTSLKQIVAREVAVAEKEVLAMLEAAFIAVTGDAVRGTILISHLAQIPTLVNHITKVATDLGGRVHAKNFFENPKSSGYVAVHLNIRLPIPGYPGRFILVEIQIHDEKTMDGSQGCVKEVSHGMYKPRGGVLDDSMLKKFDDAGKLLFYLKMIDLSRGARSPSSTEQSGSLQLMQQITGVKDEKTLLNMHSALFLNKEGLEGDYDPQFGVVIPRNREAIHAKWLALATKIAEAIKLAASPKDPTYSWTNTATSVGELLADAKKIADFFDQLCRKAARIHGCRVNFGPDDAHMIKEETSLRDKIKKDINEAMSVNKSVLPIYVERLPDPLPRSIAEVKVPPQDNVWIPQGVEGPRMGIRRLMPSQENKLPAIVERPESPRRLTVIDDKVTNASFLRSREMKSQGNLHGLPSQQVREIRVYAAMPSQVSPTIRVSAEPQTMTSPRVRRKLAVLRDVLNVVFKRCYRGGRSLSHQWCGSKRDVIAGYTDECTYEYTLRRNAIQAGGIIGAVTGGSVGAIAAGVFLVPVTRFFSGLFFERSTCDAGIMITGGLSAMAGSLTGGIMSSACDDLLKDYSRNLYPVNTLRNSALTFLGTVALIDVMNIKYSLYFISSLSDFICINSGSLVVGAMGAVFAINVFDWFATTVMIGHDHLKWSKYSISNHTYSYEDVSFEPHDDLDPIRLCAERKATKAACLPAF